MVIYSAVSSRPNPLLSVQPHVPGTPGDCWKENLTLCSSLLPLQAGWSLWKLQMRVIPVPYSTSAKVPGTAHPTAPPCHMPAQPLLKMSVAQMGQPLSKSWCHKWDIQLLWCNPSSGTGAGTWYPVPTAGAGAHRGHRQGHVLCDPCQVLMWTSLSRAAGMWIRARVTMLACSLSNSSSRLILLIYNTVMTDTTPPEIWKCSSLKKTKPEYYGVGFSSLKL